MSGQEPIAEPQVVTVFRTCGTGGKQQATAAKNQRTNPFARMSTYTSLTTLPAVLSIGSATIGGVMKLSRREMLAGAGAASAGCATAVAAVPSSDSQSLDALARKSGRHFGSAVAWSPPGADRGSFANPLYAAISRARMRAPRAGERAEVAVGRGPVPMRSTSVQFDAIADYASGTISSCAATRSSGPPTKWYPKWLAQYDFGPQAGRSAEALLTNHVQTVCRRYGERIYSYDVVNEAVQPETGEIRDTNVTRALGREAFLDLMFHTARAEAPHAQLVYNDYMSWERNSEDETHMRGVLKLLEGFRKRGTPVDALGVQSHIRLLKHEPVAAIVRESEGPWRRFIDEVVGMGYKLLITEFDVNDRTAPSAIGPRDQNGCRLCESLSRPDAELSAARRRALLGDGRPLQLARGFRSASRQAAQAGTAVRPRLQAQAATRGDRRGLCFGNREAWLAGCIGPLFAAALLASSAAGAAAPREITIDVAQARQPLDRFFDLSVGSDYPGTLIRADAQAQLKPAVDELGFRYIRFHAIFHDVLGTVKVVKGKPAYDWSGIDKLYDALLAKRIRPFVELGFTPEALKTSDNSIFWWKGNTSHPKPEMWRDLVDAFVRHLEQRYGRAQVRSWYFEVWNEPNLDGFWEKADQPAYFALYDLTARTVKGVDPQLRVGGPSTAGAAWVPEFLSHVAESGAPIDFVTTHTYGVDGGFLDEKGESDTKLSPSPNSIVGDVRNVRAQIAGVEISQVCRSTSPSGARATRRATRCTIAIVSAPWILTKLKAAQGSLDGMSYWTYTDIFYEAGPPPEPFHGGFGLMTTDGIRKPAWFAYKYLHALQGNAVPLADAEAFAASDGRHVAALLWNWVQPKQDASDRPYYTKVHPSAAAGPARLAFEHLKPGSYRLTVRRTGFRHNDPQTAYLDMGSPKKLTAGQLSTLQALTRDLPETRRVVRVGTGGAFTLTLPMQTNDVVLVELDRFTAK